MRILFKVTLIAALAAFSVQAKVLPYSSDSNTLHLWHLDEAGNPLADPAAAGSLNLLKGIQ